MKPPPFAYHAPESLDEAVATLAEQGDDAKVLAGGQSLIPLLSLRLARPTALIDLNGVSELSSIEVNGQTAIGAMTRHRTDRTLAPRSPGRCPCSPLRRRTSATPRSGTEARSAAAWPTPIPPPSSLRWRWRSTPRSRPAARRGEPDDRRRRLLLRLLHDRARGRRDPDPDHVSRTSPPRTGVSVQEMARRHGDFAMVAAVASVTLDGDVRHRAHQRRRSAGAGDRGRGRDADAASRSTRSWRWPPVASIPRRPTCTRAAAYRRTVAGVLVRRALTEASERARRHDVSRHDPASVSP